jgi:hypothetical protein
MCDYSLHHVANRPAQIEDKLVTTKFMNSITRGFSADERPSNKRWTRRYWPVSKPSGRI